MSDSLFRQEVLNFRNTLGEGDPIHLPSLFKFSAFVALFSVFCISLLLIFGSYSRKESAAGILRPLSGEIDIISSRSGRIELVAKLGEKLEKGQIIARIFSDRSSSENRSLPDKVQDLLHQDLEVISNDEALLRIRDQQRANEVRARLKQLASDRKSARNQLIVAKEHLTLLAEQERRAKDLAHNGYIRKLDWEEMHLRRLAQLEHVAEAEREVEQLDGEIELRELELDSLPNQLLGALQQLAKQRLDIKRALASAEADSALTLRAPRAARVAALLVESGDLLAAGERIAQLVGSEDPLTAELWLPSRNIGFIAPGDPVRIRVDAFPHQKFGVIEGRISSISTTAVSLAGQAEPIYKVQASLLRQSAHAYGREYPLQSGMAVQADIVMETRPFWEWLLEPVLRLRGRM